MNNPKIKKKVIAKNNIAYEPIICNIPKSNKKFKKNFVFISYSHDDKIPYIKELKSVIKPIEDVGIWIDDMIGSGQEWNPEINLAMQNCKVAVALISHNFLSSDYIVKVELPYLINAANQKQISLLNILITHCKLERFGLDKYEFVNKINMPLDSVKKNKRILCWKILADRIEELYNEHSNSKK